MTITPTNKAITLILTPEQMAHIENLSVSFNLLSVSLLIQAIGDGRLTVIDLEKPFSAPEHANLRQHVFYKDAIAKVKKLLANSGDHPTSRIGDLLGKEFL